MISLPKGDTHFRKFAERDEYQDGQFYLIKEHIKDFRCAVDVGAHVGFWSRLLSKHFDTVHAFEPIPENYACLVGNVGTNVKTYNVALGADAGFLDAENPAPSNSGAWEFKAGIKYPCFCLDAFDLENVDLIKVDVQGMEADVLKGAERLLVENRPLVITEVDKDRQLDNEAFRYLNEDIGMDRFIILGNKTLVGYWND